MAQILPLESLVLLMKNGTTSEQNQEGRGLPVTRIETISDGSIDTKRVRYVELQDTEVERWKIQQGDILLSHINSVEHIGKSAIYSGFPETLIHGMNLLLLRPNGEKVLPEYLHFGLRSKPVRTHIRSRCKRAINQASINQKELGAIELSVPSILEQRRIVDILSRAEGIVRLRREAEKKAAELIPALFLDMFGDPATNSKGWTTLPIAELCAVQTGGTPSRDNAAYYKGEIPWVKTGEVAGGLIVNTEEHISAQALAETNCKKFPVGTILVAMYGQGQTRGRCAVLGIEASTNQACAAILPSNQIAGVFLFRLLQTQYEHLRSLAQGGNQANLNLSMIKNYRVIVPPISKQNEFVERVNAVSSIQSQQATATATAQATFDALLSNKFVS